MRKKASNFRSFLTFLLHFAVGHGKKQYYMCWADLRVHNMTIYLRHNSLILISIGIFHSNSSLRCFAKTLHITSASPKTDNIRSFQQRNKSVSWRRLSPVKNAFTFQRLEVAKQRLCKHEMSVHFCFSCISI